MVCGDLELLARHARGELDEERDAEVRQHLSECAGCASTVRKMTGAAAPAGEPAVVHAETAPADPEPVSSRVLHGAGSAVPVAGPAGPDCPSTEELQQYILAALPSERKAQVKDHVTDCDTCFDRIREIRQSGANSTPPDAAQAMRDDLLPSRIPQPAAARRTESEYEDLQEVEPARISTAKQLLSHAAVAAAAAAVAVTLYAPGQRPTSPGRTPRPNPGMDGGPRAVPSRPNQFQPPPTGTGGPFRTGPGGTAGPFTPGPGGTSMPPGTSGLTTPGAPGLPGRPGATGGPGTGMPPLMGSGTSGLPGTSGPPPPRLSPVRPGMMTGGDPGSPPSRPDAQPINQAVVDAALPVRLTPGTGAGSLRLPPTTDATRKTLQQAAETSRSRGPSAAARQMEEFLRKPENRTADGYAFLGTLYLKAGERDRAHEALANAAKQLQPPAAPVPGTDGPAPPATGPATSP